MKTEDRPTLRLRSNTKQVPCPKKRAKPVERLPSGKVKIPNEEMRACRKWLRDLMKGVPFPYRTGIREALVKVRPDGIRKQAVLICLTEITKTSAYVKALATAEHRHGFHGDTYPLLDRHRDRAQATMREWRNG
jgi:hypothetical protein